MESLKQAEYAVLPFHVSVERLKADTAQTGGAGMESAEPSAEPTT